MRAEETLLFSGNGDSLRIGIVCEKDRISQAYGDAQLTIAVQSSGFAGNGTCWVEWANMWRFCLAMNALNTKMRGKAELQSMSKGELALTIQQISARGAFAVEGQIGRLIYATDHIFRHAVTFGFEIELSQVEKAAKQLARLAAETAWNVIELTRRNDVDLQ